MSDLEHPVAVAEPSTADAVVAKAQVVRARQPQPTRAATPEAELPSSSLYINREISLLEFNRRVLAQARDAEVPLLERLRFLTICSSNLDEFFEIRMAGVKQQLDFNVTTPSPDGMSAQELDKKI